MRPSNVTNVSLRHYQRGILKQFVINCAPFLGGRVLDYGCGDSPYKDVIPGEYTGFNRGKYPGTPHRVDIGPAEPLQQSWDAILCTQMLQYVPKPLELLKEFHWALHSAAGFLVLTVQTTWPEVEETDLHRFTSYGTAEMLEEAGFVILICKQLGSFNFEDFSIPLGWGFVAESR